MQESTPKPRLKEEAACMAFASISLHTCGSTDPGLTGSIFSQHSGISDGNPLGLRGHSTEKPLGTNAWRLLVTTSVEESAIITSDHNKLIPAEEDTAGQPQRQAWSTPVVHILHNTSISISGYSLWWEGVQLYYSRLGRVFSSYILYSTTGRRYHAWVKQYVAQRDIK